MDKRLKDAGYEIKAAFTGGSLPSSLYVTLNGAELAGSRQSLLLPWGNTSAAFLAAEASAFKACEAFAIEHALLDGAELVTCELCQGNGDGCRACAGAGAFLVDLPASAEPQADADKAATRKPSQGDGPDPFCGDCHGRGCPACWEGVACEACGKTAAFKFHSLHGERFACAAHADEVRAWALNSKANPKDATISALAAEVERLAGEMDSVTGDLSIHWPNTGRYIAEQAAAARALLARLGLALALCLALAGPTLAAGPAVSGPPAAARAPRHVTRPLSSISVKVMPHAAYQGRFRASRAAWAITTADADSCTAWVDGGVPAIEAAELAAFKGCRAAIDRTVDTAHAAAEKGGAK